MEEDAKIKMETADAVGVASGAGSPTEVGVLMRKEDRVQLRSGEAVRPSRAE